MDMAWTGTFGMYTRSFPFFFLFQDRHDCSVELLRFRFFLLVLFVFFLAGSCSRR